MYLKKVLDVVQCRVDEDGFVVVPAPALETHAKQRDGVDRLANVSK